MEPETTTNEEIEAERAAAERLEAAGDSEPAAPPTERPLATEERASGAIWLLLAVIMTVGVLLVVIQQSRAWDAFACESDEDCRGEKQCIEARCISAEVYETTTGREAPERQSRRRSGTPQGSTDETPAPE